MKQSSSVGNESNCKSFLDKTGRLQYVSSNLGDSFLIAAAVLNFVACPWVCFLNALVILAVKTKRRLQTHYNVLLACLALTDVIVGVIVQPLHGTVSVFLLQGKNFNEFCKIHLVLSVSFTIVTSASVLHLVLISGERYLTIIYSFTQNAVLTKDRVIVSSAIAWIVAVIICILILESMVIPAATLQVTFLSSIICFQVLVYKNAERHEKQILALQVTAEAKKQFKKEKKALRLTTLIILATFVSLLLPFIVVYVPWLTFGKKLSDDVKTTIRRYSVTIVNLNSVINPIIYTVRTRDFRVAFIELLLRKTHHEAEEIEKKLFRLRRNAARPEVREDGEKMEHIMEGRNRQIQPAAAAAAVGHEGTASGFQISNTTATVTGNHDIKVVSPNTPADNETMEKGIPATNQKLVL